MKKETLADRLNLAMEQSGMSQGALAKASGVAQQLFAFRSEHQMPPLFGHQRRTALALQLFKLGADGRSGTRQAQRCLGETAALHAGHKAAQGVEIQPW